MQRPRQDDQSSDLSSKICRRALRDERIDTLFVLLRPCFPTTSAVNKADRLYGPETVSKGRLEKVISSQEHPCGTKLTPVRRAGRCELADVCHSSVRHCRAEITRSKVRIRVSLLGVAQKRNTRPDVRLGERIDSLLSVFGYTSGKVN